MYVAICDDNVADRKHLERLLSREYDKRAGTPDVLYVDSYGEKMHFLANPLKYNIIFMDMCAETGIVEFIIEHLNEMGYSAPLVLYSSKIDYTAIPNLPEYVIHAQKPYNPEPLPEFLKLGDANVTNHPSTVKVHVKSVDRLIPTANIMYALETGNSCRIYLTDGKCMEIDEPISELRILLEPFEEFGRVEKQGIVNFKFVSAIYPTSIAMKDGTKIKISFFKRGEYTEMYNRFRLMQTGSN